MGKHVPKSVSLVTGASDCDDIVDESLRVRTQTMMGSEVKRGEKESRE